MKIELSDKASDLLLYISTGPCNAISGYTRMLERRFASAAELVKHKLAMTEDLSTTENEGVEGLLVSRVSITNRGKRFVVEHIAPKLSLSDRETFALVWLAENPDQNRRWGRVLVSSGAWSKLERLSLATRNAERVVITDVGKSWLKHHPGRSPAVLDLFAEENERGRCEELAAGLGLLVYTGQKGRGKNPVSRYAVAGSFCTEATTTRRAVEQLAILLIKEAEARIASLNKTVNDFNRRRAVAP